MAGLFVGMSVLTLAEFLELVVLGSRRAQRKRGSPGENITVGRDGNSNGKGMGGLPGEVSVELGDQSDAIAMKSMTKSSSPTASVTQL